VWKGCEVAKHHKIRQFFWLLFGRQKVTKRTYIRHMPANKDALSRYRIIDQALRNKQKQFPTKKELIDLIENHTGFQIGDRTLEKDMQDMREDSGLNYFAPIKFDKIKKGYFYTEANYSITGIPISEEDIKRLKFAAKIFTRFKGVPYLAESYRPIEQLDRIIRVGKSTGQWVDNSIVQLEVPEQMHDMEMFELFIKSILKKRVVQIRYQAFGKKESKPFLIHPYLLKEYKNRWYLVAQNANFEEIRIYGLDRITSAKDLKEKHTESFDADAYFQYSLGITVFNGEEPADIELLFSPNDAPYILSNRIHHTQNVLKNDEKGLKIGLMLHPSYELTMLIRGYGSGVKVLKPKWLEEEIKNDALKVAEK